MIKQQGKAKTIIDQAIEETEAARSIKQQGKAKTSRPYIKIAFYDQKGYSLFSTEGTFGGRISEFYPATYADEINKIDGGWEWKGRFDESCITIENFRDIHSIKVTYVSY